MFRCAVVIILCVYVLFVVYKEYKNSDDYSNTTCNDGQRNAIELIDIALKDAIVKLGNNDTKIR